MENSPRLQVCSTVVQAEVGAVHHRRRRRQSCLTRSADGEVELGDLHLVPAAADEDSHQGPGPFDNGHNSFLRRGSLPPVKILQVGDCHTRRQVLTQLPLQSGTQSSGRGDPCTQDDHCYPDAELTVSEIVVNIEDRFQKAW